MSSDGFTELVLVLVLLVGVRFGLLLLGLWLWLPLELLPGGTAFVSRVNGWVLDLAAAQVVGSRAELPLAAFDIKHLLTCRKIFPHS